MIVQNVSAAATGRTDISFTLPAADGRAGHGRPGAKVQDEIGFEQLLYDDQIGKCLADRRRHALPPGRLGPVLRRARRRRRQHRDDLHLGDPDLGAWSGTPTSTPAVRAVHPRSTWTTSSTDQAVVYGRDWPMSRSAVDDETDDRARRPAARGRPRGRRDRRRRHGDARHPLRAGRRLGRDPADRLRPLGRARSCGSAARRSRCVALAPEVFDGVDVAMFDVPDEVSARVGADRGRAGRRRGRQLRRLPDGPGRAAGRARGERRRGPATGRGASSPTRTARRCR